MFTTSGKHIYQKHLRKHLSPPWCLNERWGDKYVLVQLSALVRFRNCCQQVGHLLGPWERKYLFNCCWAIIEGLGLLEWGLGGKSGHFIHPLSLYSFGFVSQNKKSVVWLTKLKKPQTQCIVSKLREWITFLKAETSVTTYILVLQC